MAPPSFLARTFEDNIFARGQYKILKDIVAPVPAVATMDASDFALNQAPAIVAKPLPKEAIIKSIWDAKLDISQIKRLLTERYATFFNEDIVVYVPEKARTGQAAKEYFWKDGEVESSSLSASFLLPSPLLPTLLSRFSSVPSTPLAPAVLLSYLSTHPPPRLALSFLERIFSLSLPNPSTCHSVALLCTSLRKFSLRALPLSAPRSPLSVPPPSESSTRYALSRSPFLLELSFSLPSPLPALHALPSPIALRSPPLAPLPPLCAHPLPVLLPMTATAHDLRSPLPDMREFSPHLSPLCTSRARPRSLRLSSPPSVLPSPSLSDMRLPALLSPSLPVASHSSLIPSIAFHCLTFISISYCLTLTPPLFRATRVPVQGHRPVRSTSSPFASSHSSPIPNSHSQYLSFPAVDIPLLFLAININHDIVPHPCVCALLVVPCLLCPRSMLPSGQTLPRVERTRACSSLFSYPSVQTCDAAPGL
ncbi:hypothetical protein C8R44DRAFT_881848 [Mycena epipterygia]|nr:hypothetical protein C8R44DRAFT_881848 [Mycena epipterygia]